MDLEGHLPKGEFPNREWYEYAGPPRITTFGDIELADREQWFYQAVADVIRANSLLRSFPEINRNKIGIHGISWGGVITCAVMGLDQRLAFAIPVYGCGFLYQTSCPGFKKYFDAMSDTELKAYKAKWDPSNYLPACSIPVLGYVGSNDPAFPLDIWQKSMLLTKGRRMLCIPISNQHGHIWNQKEIFAFADAVVRNGKPLIRIGEARLLNGIVSAAVSDSVIDKMLLCFTRDTCDWQHREWHTTPATMKDGRVYSTLPEGATACYFNITDERGLVFSSAYIETKPSLL
jgi:dienelactone hydrolase